MSVTVTDNFTPKTWVQSYPKTWGNALNQTWMFGLHEYDVLAAVTLAIAEVMHKGFPCEVRESISISDQSTNQMTWERSCQEAFSIMETYWDFIQFRVSVSEGFTVTDDETGKVTKGVLVTLNIADRIAKGTARPYAEAFSVDDGISKEPKPTLADGFTVTDDETSRFLKGIPVTLNIAESVPKNIEKPFSTTIFIEDGFFRKAKTLRKIFETVNFAELTGKHSSLPFEETLEVVDFFCNLFTENVDEAFSVAEVIDRSFSARRVLAETVVFEELIGNNFEVKLEDFLSVRDTILRASNAILNNIFVRGGEMSTLEDFNKLVNQAPGFTEFIDFKVGEYDYEEALVKVALRSKMEGSQPTLNNLTMHVDIPDTDARGTVVIENTVADLAEPKRVLFSSCENKPFYYKPPEVNALVIGGYSSSDGVLTPYITSITTEYFEVEIRNASGSRVSGTISWFAKGY